MPSDQQTLLQEDFALGSVLSVAAQLIPPNGVQRIDNGLLNADGLIFKRGGSAAISDEAFGSTGLTFLWHGYLNGNERIFFANDSDFGVLASDEESPVTLGGDGLARPVQAAVLEDLLFIGGGYIYGGARKAQYSLTDLAFTNGGTTVTSAGGGFSANVEAGMLLQRGDERVYAVASVTNNTTLELRDAYDGATGSGVTGVFYAVYPIRAADPYQASDWYAVGQNRLFWSEGNLLRFSAINDPHGHAVNDEHELPDGSHIMGAAAVGQHLLIFTTAGTWTLAGVAFDIVDSNGNPQHRLAPYSHEMILWGASGIASWEGLLVVPSVHGIYLADGVTTPQRVSRSVDTQLELYTERQFAPGQAAVFQGHYFLPILRRATSDVVDLMVCRLDRPVKDRRGVTFYPWSFLYGAGAKLRALVEQTESAAPSPTLLGAGSGPDSRVLDVSGFFHPTIANASDHDGSDFDLNLVTRDFPTGGNTENVVRRFRTRYQLDDGPDGADPTVKFSYAFASVAPSSGARWNEVQWDAFQWADGGSEQVFTPLACDGPLSDGLAPHSCRVGERTRFIRQRIRQVGPTAGFTLRGIEVFVRPSRAYRR